MMGFNKIPSYAMIDKRADLLGQDKYNFIVIIISFGGKAVEPVSK